MVALNEQFHHNCAKSRGSYRRKDGSGRHGKSPTAAVSSVNSVACNHTNGGLTGNIPNGTTDYIWQGWQTVEERSPFGGSGSTDTPTKQYVWGTYIDECIQLNLLVAAGPQSVPVGAYYLLQDLLYRAVALTNSSGQIAEAYDCEAYGNTLIFIAPDTSGNWWGDEAVQASYGANDIVYCGYRCDPETQLYYVRNRTYNSVLGRWIERDPIGYSGGINLYGYASDSPARNFDAFGERDCDAELIACHRQCWHRRPPWPISYHSNGHYVYCEEVVCIPEYLECLAEEAAHKVAAIAFCTLRAADAFIRRHPLAVGTVVIVAGVAYVVATGGTGVLLLVPAAVP